MKAQIFAALLLMLGGSAITRAQTPAPQTPPPTTPPPSRAGVIELQGVMTGTKEGQKGMADLDTRQEPKKKQLEKQQADIRDLQGKLQRGANTLADTAKQDLERAIDQKAKSYQRDMEDAEAEYQDDLRKIMGDLEQKILPVIERYAVANGYSVLLEVDNPNTPVVYFDPSANITKDIIEEYDKVSPGPPAPTSAGKPAGGAGSNVAAPKSAPPPTPAPRKQP